VPYGAPVTLDAWTTLGVVAAALVLLVRGTLSPALVIFGATITLLVVGVIDAEQALSGFSNPAPFTVAALYVVAAAVQKTGALTPLMQRTLGERGYYRRPLLRVLPLTATVSAFLNNTPIVAMLIPQVGGWAERRQVSVSKLLMPLSFAALLGGTVTLIGTSTNLVVSGQMVEAGLGPMGFFEVGAVGLPVALIGVAAVIALAPRVLPARRTPMRELTEQARRFSIEMVVVPGGPVDGRSVEQARLRHLSGVFLTSIDRGDTIIAPVRPDTVLRGGNRLRFSGQAGTIVDLQAIRGLEPSELEHVLDLDHPQVSYCEVVLGSQFPGIGQTLAEVGFRARYQAAVVAIHRAGALVEGKLGRVRLRVGDTLLVVADPGFADRWHDKADFLLVADMGGSPPSATSRAWLPMAVLAGVVGLAALGITDILVAALVGAVLLVATGVLTPLEARRSVDLEVIVVIAAAFGIAAAMESSGLAQQVSDALVGAFDAIGPRGVLLGVVIATVVLTEMITNNAAALLMFPIAVAAAPAAGVDPRGAAIAVAVAASASFLTPIGYQTNTMVYGPGGYRFGDYARLGLPLTMLVVAALVLMVPVVWPA
jgi:di/tricarboxylate transporter